MTINQMDGNLCITTHESHVLYMNCIAKVWCCSTTSYNNWYDSILEQNTYTLHVYVCTYYMCVHTTCVYLDEMLVC